MSEPLVTVMISPREGHVLSERSLQSVLDDDGVPFKLIYVDIASPPRVQQAIRAQAEARGFPILRHDEWLPPAAARKRALATVETKYVAFVDNDVLVERGCLAKLVACAEETGAGLVCPLYLQAGGGREPTIHMAGGGFLWSEGDNPVLIGEGHWLNGAPTSAAAALTRDAVDYAEYHYVLGRTDLLNRPGAISDDVLQVHEHIDLALFARQQGMALLIEPTARATYMAFDPRPLMDLPFYRRRWDVDACRESLRAFANRWLTDGNAWMVDQMMPYAAQRLREIELRREGASGTDLGQPIRRDELAQTRCDLRDRALERGYTKGDVTTFDQTCDFATVLFDGLYRPDGRPFLNHVIGAASVLVRYELRPEIVHAGLLHAAFTHRPQWMAEARLSTVLKNQEVQRLIVGQPATRAFLERADADISTLNVFGAQILCILAANETDMRLSGEYRVTGRPADHTPQALARIGEALAPFGIDGLAASACQAKDEVEAWPLFGNSQQHVSFRLDDAKRRFSGL